ncbi:MAG: cellobiose phosphorylase, partial [Acholeplasmatales bacterium]|nr:cellobiose phosphorylase [Acholeplasmatales bacterium]
YECLSGFRNESLNIKPKEKIEIKYAKCINENLIDYNVLKQFDSLYELSIEKWNSYYNNIEFDFANNTIMKWVSIQPVLRRLYGCSFLPHHDYGRGGRGWRDLWQDCLALIKMDTIDVKNLLLNNFKGVRVDGSNATIIGSNPGEFKADRNNIARMWMDHGAWPLTTLMLYIENNNDYNILNESVTYFKDSHISFSTDIDSLYDESYGNLQMTLDNTVYEGTILEHLLVQTLPIIFNVGAHNNLKLMGADWNDALDMASNKGESVAFTSFYASNLKLICQLLEELKEDNISIFEELSYLVDVDYDFNNVLEKNKILDNYFNSVKHNISGNKVSINKQKLIERLTRMHDEIVNHINKNEWQENDTLGFYNSYYDNDSMKLGSLEEEKMLLTGQVFAIMGGVASDKEIKKIVSAADKYLFNPKIGGYVLNNDFKELKLNMGRQFGFAYGHKENGAMFSHMTVMYANALYKRGFVLEGHKVLKSIFDHIRNFNVSKCYPSIPEYFDPKGRGMYPYLTGSASWLLLTMIDQVFGIKIVKDKLY